MDLLRPAARRRPSPGAPPQVDEPDENGENTPSAAAFEEQAREILSKHFGRPLPRGKVPGIPKVFDFVSPDGSIVGDAKYYRMVGGQRRPPAKFSNIAEYVWLLEKTSAATRFLVFGNDRRVPVLWLSRYGGLVKGVKFYFIDADGRLEELL